MTFRELCSQTTKECGIGITYDQMQRILATQWRLILEELLLRPGESSVKLTGLMQIYLKKRNLNCGIWENGVQVAKEVQPHWCFRIKTSTPLRAMLRGEIDITDIRIGGFPLYFDKPNLSQPESRYKNGRIRLDNITREKKIAERKAMAKIKEENQKEEFKNKLPEE